MSHDITRYEVLSPIKAANWREEETEVSDERLIDPNSPARNIPETSDDEIDADSDSESLEPAPIANSLELESPPAPFSNPEDDDSDEPSNRGSPGFARAHELRLKALSESARLKQQVLDNAWKSPQIKRRLDASHKIQHKSPPKSPAFEDWSPGQWSRLVKYARALNLSAEKIKSKRPLPITLISRFPESTERALNLRLHALVRAKKIQ